MNRPYFLDYARLASGAFYETILLVTFYEIINNNAWQIFSICPGFGITPIGASIAAFSIRDL
jgi:hypothetical protein